MSTDLSPEQIANEVKAMKLKQTDKPRPAKNKVITCGFRNKTLSNVFAQSISKDVPEPATRPFYIGKRTYVRFSDGSIRRASGIKMPEKRKLVAV